MPSGSSWGVSPTATHTAEPASRSRVRSLAIAAGSVLLVGVVVGFLPFSFKDAPCGSPFVATPDPFEADLEDTWSDASDIVDNAAVGSHQAGCADLRSVRGLGAIALIGIGVLGLGTWSLFTTPLAREARG
jgi:hypothetical protein